ncbi:MAG TPA: glycosyltransferase family 4 protein [Polyangia bacterium]
MSLTVLSVAYTLAPVGPGAVGGAEQVLTMLDEELAGRGHRSVVVAATGSRAAGRLVPTPRPAGVLDDAARARAIAHTRAAIARALARFPVDVVHLHGLDFPAVLPPAGPPAVVTLHLPPAWYPAGALAPRAPTTHLVCVSAAQRRACPPGTAARVIANGVRLERFRLRRRKLGYAVALGRICPEKGFHLALDAAARAGVPLVLAGQVFPYPEHERYFARQIAPRLGPAARFVGPVGPAQRRRLLAGARCLVAPSLAPETSSLVAMEALASGTPVVASGAGALPEIVDDGRTGFIVEGVEAIAAAVSAAGALDPAACRRAAEERFDAARMLDDYLDLYRAVTGRGRRDAAAAP